MSKARPFTIAVPDDVLDGIRSRVRAYDWDALPDAGQWWHGTSMAYLRDFTRYWLEEYDWRASEAALNRWPQFKAEVDGLELHFIHVKGSQPQPRAMIVSHGWPGSVAEFLEIIEPLAHPERFGGDAADGFDLVVPSLPGYGFSGRPASPIGPRETGRLFHRLMTDVLGYERYLAQGGDWGSAVSGWMGADHAPACAAVHLNMAFVRAQGVEAQTEEEHAFDQRMKLSMMLEGAYFQLQATKPQTLAFAMMDSPVGVAAWILEKFAAWSDLPRDAANAPDLSARYTRERLLTNIMIYLVTKSFATSTWMYRGMALQSPREFPAPVSVPVGVAAFPDPCFPPPPRSLAERSYNIVHWTPMTRGGHFAAMEEPQLLIDDIRAFARAHF